MSLIPRGFYFIDVIRWCKVISLEFVIDPLKCSETFPRWTRQESMALALRCCKTCLLHELDVHNFLIFLLLLSNFVSGLVGILWYSKYLFTFSEVTKFLEVNLSKIMHLENRRLSCYSRKWEKHQMWWLSVNW